MGVSVTRFRLVLAFAQHVLGDAPISIARASEDPELKRYLDATGALASQSTEMGGHVYINLDDTDPWKHAQLWGAFLEELAHAIQNRRIGHVPLSANDADRNARECEVARCMVTNAGRLSISKADREHYQEAVTVYCGGDDDHQ